jgi:hypothetical protein
MDNFGMRADSMPMRATNTMMISIKALVCADSRTI